MICPNCKKVFSDGEEGSACGTCCYLNEPTPQGNQITYQEKYKLINNMEQEKEKLVHDVVKGDDCYYCTVCRAASGDGDGLVGKECGGLPPLGFSVGDKAPVTKDGMR